MERPQFAGLDGSIDRVPADTGQLGAVPRRQRGLLSSAGDCVRMRSVYRNESTLKRHFAQRIDGLSGLASVGHGPTSATAGSH
jgi:hypothetical protein